MEVGVWLNNSVDIYGNKKQGETLLEEGHQRLQQKDHPIKQK